MDYSIDTSIKDEIRKVSSKYDLSYWREIDRNREFPVEYWNSLAKAGLFGIIIEKKWGGSEKCILDLSLAVQETSEHYAGLGSYLYLSGSLVSSIFSRIGTEEQKTRMLPKLARGELKISIALTEDLSGFDATSLRTKATKSGENYSLSGSKTFINSADVADYLIIFARTEASLQDKKSIGISMFLVDANSPSIRKKKLERLGMNFVNSFELNFQDLIVKESAFIGEAGNAWKSIIPIFNLDRILTSASLIGTGSLALDQACDWARKRTVFGKAIATNQGIQFPLAECAAQLEVAEALTLKAASLADQGKSYSNEASLALLTSSTAATAATDRGLQTFGGHGYYKDYDVERFWRDVRAHRIHPVSEELLLATIAERTLGLPKSY